MVKYFLALFTNILLCLIFTNQNLFAQNLIQNKPVHLIFDVYNKNLHVVTIEASYQLTADHYYIQAHFASAGLANFFVNLNMISSVNGNVEGNNITPNLFRSSGKSKGEKFQTLIDFHNPQQINIKTLIPGKEKNRDALDQNQINNSMDIMSAMIKLIRHVRTENKCDDQLKIFDGLRIFTFNSQTIGKTTVPSTWTSPYRGQALLCKAIAQQTGGLKQSRHRALMAKPQPGYLWFQSIDSIGILPIRFEFDHPKMGKVIVILRKIPNINQNY